MAEIPLQDLQWEHKKKDEMAAAIVAKLSRIRQNNDWQRQTDLLNASLYGNVEHLGFGPGTYQAMRSDAVRTGSQLSLNVVRNMTGAVVSRIAAKSCPKATFVTEGGNWELRQKAKKLEKACDGALYQAKFKKKFRVVFRDCAVFGLGLMKVYPDYDAKKVAIERVLQAEMVVDTQAALYGDESVRELGQYKYYDRANLCAMFPKKADELMKDIGRGDDEIQEIGFDSTCDQLLVREIWIAPSGLGKNDGRHAIVANNQLLHVEDWKRKPPFGVIRWDDPIAGWYADGLASELCGIQLEINDMLAEMQEAHHGIKGKWLVEMMSQVNEQHINDESLAILKYRLTAPMYVAPSAVAPDFYAHLWNLYQKAYEIAGISQLAATSQKPAGLDSGIAQREYADQQSERFMNLYETVDEFVLDINRLAIEAMRDLSAVDEFKVNVASRNYLETIDFKANDIEEHAYELKMMPTSMLPSTVAGKKQFIADMSKDGILDPEELLELFDIPDVESFRKRRNATRNLTDQMLNDIMNGREYQPPEPLMFFPTAIKAAVEFYLEVRSDNAPKDKLDLVRRWITQARAQKKAADAEAAAEAAAAAMPPPQMQAPPPAAALPPAAETPPIAA